MTFSRLLVALVLSLLSLQVFARALGRQPHELVKPYKRAALQDIVTWDQYSIFVHGKRIFFYSGEVHPFRLPVPSLYLDIFHKIKALGYTGVSFYIDWALLEGQQGTFNGEGVFDLQPFLDAASQAGLYLLARPGPYINAEASGGGFPGWLQRTEEIYRTPAYVKYTDNYAANVGPILAKAQVTNGGPLILLQIENEYSNALAGLPFPDPQYFVDIEDQWRKAGIVIPFLNNDIGPNGLFTPGNISGSVDIYGFDDYPMGFNCKVPATWPSGSLPSNLRVLHDLESHTTPFAIIENQGGSFDQWGGPGYDNCAAWFNMEAERIVYKNDFSFGTTIMNMYMTYGGTNWGNLGFPGVYTSYDYGAIIAEDRTIAREKYSEAKLNANFAMASGDVYLTAVPTESAASGTFVSDNSLAVTPLKSNSTMFYVVRHGDYTSQASTPYRLTVTTSQGSISIPQLSSTLMLNGRDSKIHVTDYDVGGTNMLYASAEIFTWKAYGSYKVLILYGGPGETHEAAFVTTSNGRILEGNGVTIKPTSGSLQLNWAVTSARKVVLIGSNFFVYLLDRNDAYNYWVLELPAPSPVNNFHDPGNTAVIVRAGYLLRTATFQGSTLALTGDINVTTTVEVVGYPEGVTGVSFNQFGASTARNPWGVIGGVATYTAPTFSLPVFTDLVWKVLDSLPETRPDYDDSAWTNADHTTSTNPFPFMTPTSLYGSDYGFNAGNLIYRGHFTANGKEDNAGTFSVNCTGGLAFGFSVWLDNTFLGSWPGNALDESNQQTLTLPALTAGQQVNLTVLIDQMGMKEAASIGSNAMKTPRGIMGYGLSGHANTDITWKITGNLGGEQYVDKTRGPLNEGGLFAERNGYHLPNPPSDPWALGKPFNGLSAAGVYFYTTNFNLNIPAGYDVPLAFQFERTATDDSATQNYRCQLYVNGYQFGKFINNIGPQYTFPVPEGILNYKGVNYIGLSLWSLSGAGSVVKGLQLISTATIQSGFGTVALSPQPSWTARPGAY